MVETALDADERMRRGERWFTWYLRLAFGLLWAFLSYITYLGIVEPLVGARPWPSGLGLAWLVMLSAPSVAVTWAMKDRLLGR